jgi:WD40 repeat protein
LVLWNPHTGQEVFRTTSRGDAIFGHEDRLLQPFPGMWRQRAGPLIQVEAARSSRTLLAGTTAQIPVRDYSDCAVHPNGRLLAVSTFQGVSLMDLATGRECEFIPGRSPHVLFEPSGTLLTRLGFRLQRWPVRADPKDPLRLRIGPPEQVPIPGQITCMARSADGTVMAVAIRDGARVWQQGRPAEAIHLQPHPDCRYVAVSPDGKLVATGSHNHFGLKVWDAATGKLLRELLRDSRWTVPTFSPDSRWLFDRRGRSWRTLDWSEGPRGPGKNLAVAPDMKLMAWGGQKGFILLTDPVSGRELARLEDPHNDVLEGLTFTPDGAQLVSVTNDSLCVRVWDLRKLREGLACLDLDWDTATYPPAPHYLPGPLTVTVDQGK